MTSADEIEQRATSAMAGYVGGQDMLRLNLQDAVALAREVESKNAFVLTAHCFSAIFRLSELDFRYSLATR